jgi:integrase/recombinase XerD
VSAPLPIEAEEFLAWLVAERGRAANTVAAYRRDLYAYTTWLQGRSLDSVRAGDLVAYVAADRAEGRAAAT